MLNMHIIQKLNVLVMMEAMYSIAFYQQAEV